MENHEVAWIVAGVFALLAGIVSFLQMRLHLHWCASWPPRHCISNAPRPPLLRRNHNDQLRKYVMRILFMVPVYALESWMGLRFKDGSLYFDVARWERSPLLAPSLTTRAHPHPTLRRECYEGIAALWSALCACALCWTWRARASEQIEWRH
jgi:hypothetical protein